MFPGFPLTEQGTFNTEAIAMAAQLGPRAKKNGIFIKLFLSAYPWTQPQVHHPKTKIKYDHVLTPVCLSEM